VVQCIVSGDEDQARGGDYRQWQPDKAREHDLSSASTV
jgi:hypothetical protein